MNPESPPDAPAVNRFVRAFVVGLPLGLLVMGVLSFVIYFQKRHAKELAAAAPSRYAAMLRKEVNLGDFARYVRIFEREIGPRSPGKPENIEAAQSFVESTLGFGNMGYQVLRRESGAGGEKAVHFEVELTGQSASLAPLLVTARYDGEGVADVSALLVLANAFTGTRHPRTIRFISWFGRPEEGAFDLKRYRESLPPGDAPDERSRVLEVKGPAPDDSNALETLQGLELAIKTAAR
jgi:hypothetical protein